MSYINMTPEQLTEVARTRSPFATDGRGGVDTNPTVSPKGSWQKLPQATPEDALAAAGIYKVDSTRTLVKYVAQRSKPTTKRGPVVRGVEQNRHAWALLNDRELSPTELAIGLRIHYYAYAPSSGGRCEKARATLASHCKVSESTLKRSAQTLVERGYFQRIDSGKGGTAGRGKSVYVPTLPEWQQSGGSSRGVSDEPQ